MKRTNFTRLHWANLGAALVVAMLSAPAHTASFVDDFSGAPFGLSFGGMNWSAATSTSGEGQNPTIVSTTPCTSPCVQFEFTGNASLSGQGHSELRLYRSSGFDEITMEWQQFFPTAWTHRDSTGSDDNQFVYLFSSPAAKINVEFDFDLDGAGTEIIRGSAIIDKGEATENTVWTAEGAGIADTALENTWLNLSLYVKAATSTSANDGIVRLSINGAVVVEDTTIDLFSDTGTNLLHFVQFMGRAQSGFSADSFTYIDDLSITARPSTAIAFVLDKSGSMGGSTDPAVAPGDAGFLSKFDAAKTAAKATLAVLQPHLTSADRVGVVYFDSIAKPKLNPSDGTTIFVPATSADITALNSQIDSEATAGGSTSVGNGLDSAENLGFNQFPRPYELVLLLTDGYQNTSLFVVEDSTTWPGTDGTFHLGTDRYTNPATAAFPADARICVLALGIGTQSWQDFNRILSEKRCRDLDDAILGTAAVTALKEGNPTTLTSDFINTAATILALGDKLEKVAEDNGVIAAASTVRNRFAVSRNDLRISIPIVWWDRDVPPESFAVRLTGPRGENLILDPESKRALLLRPDGTVARLSAEIQFDRDVSFIVVSFPLPLDENQMPAFDGEWQLELERAADDHGATGYGAIFLADNKSIATDVHAECPDCGTGDTVQLRARLTDRGAPILGARVLATVERPNDGVGNVLAETSVSQIRRMSMPAAGVGVGVIDQLTPAERKLQLLLTDADVRERLRRIAEPPIELTDPDNDGVYTGTFDKTKKPDTYHFRFDIVAQNEINGAIARTTRQSVTVRAKPDRKQSGFQLDILDDPQAHNALLTFTPRDRFGNYIVGYGNQLRVTGDATVVGDIVDQLDGSYAIRLQIADVTITPNIDIAIGSDTLANALERDGKKPKWWILLLLLIIAALTS